MNALNKIAAATIIALSAASASAQDAHAGHGAGHDAHAAHGAGHEAHGAAAKVAGEVKKVDKEAGKITLRHGEIKNLGMAPMTMVFRVKDKAMLDKVKAGDKVNFAAEKVNGALTVTELEAAQ